MRAAPSASYVGTLGDGGTGRISVLWSAGWATLNGFNVTETTLESFRVDVNTSSGFTANQCAGLYFYQSTPTDVRVMLNAEL
jgi:hypothetical protein